MYKVTPIIDPRRFETYVTLEEVKAGPKFLTAKEVEEYSKTHRYFKIETIKWEPARED